MARQLFGIVGAFSAFLAMSLHMLLALTTVFPASVLAQRPEPTIYNSSSKYVYDGCFNETTGIAGSSGARALGGGTNFVGAGNMTVPDCLAFCSSSGSTTYTYAGIEYARECWCAQDISGLSVKFADSECDLGCDGNATQACGGTLKLSVYVLGGAATTKAMSGVLLLSLAATTVFNLI